MNIQDGTVNQTTKLPRTGNAIAPNQPVLLWRPATNRLNIDFVPASGSSLPVSLVFYPARLPGLDGAVKTYQP
ncbi:hypothetical protein [Deinococcus radiodurans]